MDTYQLVLKSLAEDELNRLLMGEGEYHLVNKWAELPTDLSEIFLYGFNPYIELNPTKREVFNQKVDEALGRLLNDPIGTWWCVSIIYSFLNAYQRDALKFRIGIEGLSTNLTESIARFSKHLEGERAFVGWRFENGLIDDLQNKVRKMDFLGVDLEP